MDSAPPPHFLPAWFQRQSKNASGMRPLGSSQFPVLSSQQNPDVALVILRTDNWESRIALSPSRKKTIE
jgi:hypothetical protein